MQARPVDGMAVREIDRMWSSVMPVQVQVSLIDRGVRFVETSFRKASPRFLPPGPQAPHLQSEPASGVGGVNVESADPRFLQCGLT